MFKNIYGESDFFCLNENPIYTWFRHVNLELYTSLVK